MKVYPKEEILETHYRYIEIRNRIEAGELKWSALGDFFTEDAVYIDQAWGRIDGGENILVFLEDSMKGLEEWSFPHEWEAVDGNYLMTGWQNRLPGQRPNGTFYQAPGTSRMLYAGNGKFAWEHDLYNMAHIWALIGESGWKPEGVNMPPENIVRLHGWEP